MYTEDLEIYSTDSNYAVIKPPGRRFPGAVIQGDTLASLARMANNIARLVVDLQIDNEDLLENAEELNNALVGRVIHYQQVLSSHDIELPFTRPLSEDYIVELLPSDDEF